MKTFIRLNILSAFYGLLFCLFHIVYVYWNWLIAISPLSETRSAGLLFSVVVLSMLLSSFSFCQFTGKWLHGTIRYLSIVLWLPYYLLSIYVLFITIMPQIPPQYEPAPGGGFVILIYMTIYPVFIGMISGLAHDSKASIQ
ncbi:hypothetical protein [Bacillus sp. B-jedd]|uniref:hypothetical protein n=1 Tax=Bacillus sp. B-jedd TaxID=1476857 RepID=UPI0005156510|nr:hypothetical protein [Bacillus sp. B-jedd]CEG28896.1 hypothetical protein BN1002_03821 [Bacillus sp. B-jedd]